MDEYEIYFEAMGVLAVQVKILYERLIQNGFTDTQATVLCCEFVRGTVETTRKAGKSQANEEEIT